MRVIDADKLYPDCLTKKGLAISQNQIADAPTVDTYTEDDVQYAIKEGHQVGYEMAKAKFERPQGEWKTVEGFDGDEYYECSNCGEPWVLEAGTPKDNNMNFCPNCGADMRKEEEDG